MQQDKNNLTKLESQAWDSSGIPVEQRAKNSKEAGNFYYQYGYGKKLNRAFWNQWIEVSLEEVAKSESYKEARNAWEDAPTMSFVKTEALEKMLSFADNKKQILSIFRTAPHDSRVKFLAYGKLKD